MVQEFEVSRHIASAVRKQSDGRGLEAAFLFVSAGITHPLSG